MRNKRKNSRDSKKYKITRNIVQFDRSIERTYYKPEIYKNLVGFIGYNNSSKCL